MGYKSVSWNALTVQEVRAAEDHLEKYKKQLSQSFRIPEAEVELLAEPYDLSMDGKTFDNPMSMSDRQVRHMVLRAKFRKQIYKVRQQHLDSYRALVSKYPIINYLSSSPPSSAEIYDATQRIMVHAKSELAEIRSVGGKGPSRNFDSLRKARKLLDYGVLVEDFLAENPEYCGIATQESRRRGRANLAGTLLSAAPVLAASFLAPPAAAIGLALGAGGAMSYRSYSAYVDQRQSAYSSPLNDGSLRSDQATVDQAREGFQRELRMIPLDAILAGGLSKGLRLRKAGPSDR